MSFLPVFRMIVTSDIHVHPDEDIQLERFSKGMKFAYDYASESEYKKIDAFFAVGDFADSGSEKEMLRFKAVLDESIAPETEKTLMLASHEFKHTNEADAIERLAGIFSQQPDNHKVIGGFHCICLSTEDGCSIKSGKQMWLREQLKKAAEDDPEKPIFCFQHPHLFDTVYGSINWGDDDIISILMDYPQVVDFSGHSHAPINDPRSVHQKYFTCFGTGSFDYFELDEFDKIYGTVPPDCDECAQFLIVEVNAENSVRVLPVDVITNNFFPCESFVECPREPDTFVYTHERALAAAKPYFEKDTFFKVDYSEGEAEITFGQAKIEKEYVDSYTIVVRKAENNIIVRQINVSSSYYLYNMPETVTVKTQLSEGEYLIQITANGFWNNKSERLEKAVTL